MYAKASKYTRLWGLGAWFPKIRCSEMGYSSSTVPYNTSSLHHVMLLSLQSLRCVISYCSFGWCVKDGAVHHSHQQWLIPKWLRLGVTVRVRARVRECPFLPVLKCDEHLCLALLAC